MKLPLEAYLYAVGSLYTHYLVYVARYAKFVFYRHYSIRNIQYKVMYEALDV